MKKILFILLLGFNSFIYAQDKLKFTDLYGDYLGQTPPGDTSVVFAPEIVSISGRYEYGLSISPDGNEIFYTADSPGEGLSFIKKVNGQWSEPQTANLRGNNSWEFEAFYSVDGQKLFFTSDTNKDSKFWFANKNGNSWSRPEYLNSPVNNTPVMWCTFTSGGTIYYGNNDNWKIHRAKFTDGKYSSVENLEFNGTHPSVAADESFFLFNSSSYGGYGKNDILVVFKKADNTWSDPINLGNKINTSYGETCASLSPDGKYIFFSRYNEPEEKCNIYWVNSSIIDSLKEAFYFRQQFANLFGDYLGQIPPGDTPVVFARGIISDSYQQHGAPSFSPDGNIVFWQTNQRPANDNEKWLTFSMTMQRVGDSWTAPEISPYGSMPFFSPDGKRIYFAGKEDGDDPCYVEKQVNSWSEPKSIGLITRFPELKNVFFPSIANNGTIYFMGHAEGLWLNIGIYRAELINGEYTKPELLPPGINAPGGMRNWAPFIAPDESYLIFCSTRGLPEYDQGDLHICFRQPDGSWTEPVNMGASINTSEMERFSSLSPDGKYLFFTRDTPGFDEDVYWVSTGIIEKLRGEINKKK